MKNVLGHGQEERFPIGAIVVRTRHKRNNDSRQFIKIASPSKWVLNARYVWEQAFGFIPKGCGIHHVNGNRLDDSLANLELVSKATHLNKHRNEFMGRAIAASIVTHRRLRWSTKRKPM